MADTPHTEDAPGELIQQASVLLARATNDLARIQELFDAHRRGETDRLNDLLKRKSSLTPKGNIRHLGKNIVNLLAQVNKPLTSAAIADALYSDAYGIDRSLFRRRVIVVVSRMFLEGRFIDKVQIDGERENRWGLIQWAKDQDATRNTEMTIKRTETLSEMLRATPKDGPER